MGGKTGKGIERGGTRRGRACLRSRETRVWGATLRLPAQAVLTSHLDSEAEAGGSRRPLTLTGVVARMGCLCSLDAEDAAGALGAQLQALALLHRPPIVAPEDRGTSPRQFTAQHHWLPRGHTEWAGGCLWGKELDWGLWTERGEEQLRLAPTSPTQACQEHPPARLTLKVTASSWVSHTYSPASSGWAWGRVRVRVGPSAPSCRASDASTSSPSLYQRTWDPAGATSQRSSTRPGAPNCRSRERAAGRTILSGGAGGWTERGARRLSLACWLLSPSPSQRSSWEACQLQSLGTYCVPGAVLSTLRLLSPHSWDSLEGYCCWLRFTDEDLRPLSRKVTCSRSHGQKEVAQICLTPMHSFPLYPYFLPRPSFASDALTPPDKTSILFIRYSSTLIRMQAL